MTQIKIQTHPEALRTREPLALESSPDRLSVRVKVYNAVMQRDPSKVTQDTTPSEGSITLQNSSSPPSCRRKMEPFRGPKFTIIGPLPPQFMEIADSSEGDSKRSDRSSVSEESKSPAGRRACGKSRIRRRASTSQLPDSHFLGRNHSNPFSSFAGSTRSFTGVIIRSLAADVGELHREEAYDQENLELGQSTASKRGDFRGDGGSSPNQPVLLLFNDDVQPPRKPVDPAVILLQNWLSPVKTPSQTVQHRASKRASLAPILSLPSSPTDNIRALRRSSRAVSDDDHARSAADSNSEECHSARSCQACGREISIGSWMRVIPCNHIVCSTCFSSSISAVSVSRNSAQCPHCSKSIQTFTALDAKQAKPFTALPPTSPRPPPVRRPSAHDGIPVYPVLRIDNVAWDITPQIVQDYLPGGVLPVDHPSPIHIPLDRTDGRTKDYMFIEVADEDAARKVLKYRQNSLMPGGPLTGGRKRPVTITSVPASQLVDELRPRCAAELHGLLAFCRAAILCPKLTRPSYTPATSLVAPTGIVHLVKNRHGPFYAVMSILTKLKGRESPAYWDVFHLASGAMEALAIASQTPAERYLTVHELSLKSQDEAVLNQLSRLFHSAFRSFPDRC